MPTDNSDQIADWNGAMGRLWAENQREIDAVVVPFGVAALATAAPRAGERVIDVGCGCGDTTIEIARVVGGAAVCSGSMCRSQCSVARLRASQPGNGLSSAKAVPPPRRFPGMDLLFSRFGVMFFGEPAADFRHLRTSLRAGGRCVFVCWRTPRGNACPRGARRHGGHAATGRSQCARAVRVRG
jgi:SAM-dependent methyltransferase